VVTWPLGEGASITLRLFPDHDEIVGLTFAAGENVAGHPPVDVAGLATGAIAMIRLADNSRAAATELVAVRQRSQGLLDDVLEALGLRQVMADTDDDATAVAKLAREIFVRQVSNDSVGAADAYEWARQRSRRRRLDDAFLREVCEFRSEHGVRATAEKFATDDRQVQRWLRRAVERGFTYKGMRKR
jgi:hypothetical protein